MEENKLQKRILDVLKSVSKSGIADQDEINSLISLLSKPDEESLSLSPNSFYGLFKNTQNAVAIYKAVNNGKNFVFVDLNLAAEKIEKFKKSKVIGKRVTEIFPGIKNNGLLSVFTNVWKTGKVHNHPITIYKDDKIVGWRENHVYKLPSGHIVSIYKDLTNEINAQNKLKESELNLKSLINNNDQSIWSIDSDYNYIIFNDFFKKQYFKTYKIKPEIGNNALDLLTKKQYDFWKAKYDKALSGKKFSFEFNEQIGKNIKYFVVSLNPIKSTKKITGVSALAVDITKQRLNEIALAESEGMYKLITESSVDVIFRISQNGTLLYFSESIKNILGYKPSELVGKPFHRFIAKSEVPNARIRLKSAFNKKNISHFTTKALHKNGKIIDLEINGAYFEKDGELFGQGSIRDISTRLKTENKLRQSEENYKGIFNTASDAIYILNGKNEFIHVNRGAELMYGYKPDVFIGKTPEFVSAPGKNDFAKVLSKMNKAFKGKKQKFEFWGLRKNGDIFPKDVTLYPGKYNGEKVIIAIGRDISERMAAQDEIQKRENNFKNLIEFAPDAFFHGNSKGDFINCNRSAVKLTGYSKKELLSLNISNLFSTKTIEEKPFRYDLLELGRVIRTERVLTRKDNSEILIEMNSRKMGDGTLQSFMRDITEKKKSDNALKESEEKYKRIVHSLKQYYYEADRRGVITYINPEFEVLTGSSEKELIGTLSFLLIEMEFRAKIVSEYKECLKTKPSSYSAEFVAVLNNKNIWVEQLTSFQYDQKGNLIKASNIVKDISERKEAEATLRESERNFRLLFENSPLGTYIAKPDGTILDVNKTLLTVLGSPSADATKKINVLNYTPLDQNGYADLFRKCVKENKTQVLEIPYTSNWGKKIFLSSYIIPLSNSDGIVEKVYTIMEDVTARKDSELALRESENKYKNISDSTSDYLFSTILTSNGKSKMDWVGGSFEKITGYTFDEYLENGGWTATIHPEDVKIDNAAYEELKNNRKIEIEVRVYKKDKSIFWARCSASPVWNDRENRVGSILGAVKDITEEKNAEIEVKKSEEKYKLISALTSDYLFSTVIDDDNNSLLEWVGGSFEEITGYTLKEYKKVGGWRGTLHPEDVKIDNNAFAQLLKNQKARIQVRTFHKSGKIVWVETFGSPVWDKKTNKIIGINGAVRDITKEKEISLALEKSEEKYKTISNLTSDYLSEVTYNNNGKVVTNWIAGSFKKITGYTIEEYKEAGDWLAHVYPDDMAIYKNALAKLKKNKKVNYQIRFHHKNGSVHWLNKSCSPIWDRINNRLTGIIGANSDITDEKQAQLVQEIQYNVANAIVREKNKHSLFKYLRNELSKILNTTNFYIAFYDEITGLLKADVDSDEKDEISSWPKEKSISGYVIQTRKKLHIYKEEILKLKEEGKLELVGTLPEVWLGVPLFEREKTVGVMVIQSYSNKNAFNRKSIELFEVIGNQISLYLERDKVKEDAQRLSRAIVQSPVSVVITNPDGEIEYVNPRFEKVSGYTFEEIFGQNPRILKSNEHDELFYKNLWDTILSGKDWKGEIRNQKKNGELYWENVIISPIQNESGILTHFVSIKEDVTERKQMIRDIIKAKEDAVSSEKIKTEFLAQMSHEIRSPLNVVMSFIGLIKDEIADTLSEDMIYSFQSIESASNRIIRTIELILNMTDIQLGTFNISVDKINVVEMLNQVKGEYIQSAKNKGLNLNLVFDFKRKIVASDEYALRQIVSNLVDNAIKYTDAGHIDIYAENDKNAGIIIKVKDTGIGMKEEYLPTLFNAFTQEEQGYTRKFDGNGLGMALVKNYCDIISAKISVKSKKGKGSIFTLQIPNLNIKE